MSVPGPGRRSAGILAAPLLLAGLIAGLSPAAASAATCTPGKATQPLSPGDNSNRLDSVSVLSACNVWAAGFFDDTKLGERTLIEHWNGTAWTVVASPHPGSSSRLDGIRAFSPTSIWAVGTTFSSKSTGPRSSSLILHYNGHTWVRVPSPSPGKTDNELDAVRWVSAKDAWAVGIASTGHITKTLIVRWNGTRWRQVASPSPASDNQLFAVAVNSRTDAWAVGDATSGVEGPLRGFGAAVPAAGSAQSLILHWNGTSWKRVPATGAGDRSALLGVGSTGTANVWAVGQVPASAGGHRALALRWRGRGWARVTTPAGQPGHSRVLEGVAATSAGNVWAVGTDSATGDQQGLALRWNGSRWMTVASIGAPPGSTSELIGVAAGSATNVWAVGDVAPASGPSQAFVFHCC